MVSQQGDVCPEPARTSRKATVDWLLHASLDRIAPVIVQRWDDPDWEHVWRMYIAALPSDENRRQHLHDVAMISSLPEAGQSPAYCSLIRLKWTGYLGSGNCDAEEEIIDWAIQALRATTDDCAIQRIIAVLISWERDFDSPIAGALNSLCADCSNANIRKAAMEALVAHSNAWNADQESPNSPKLQLDNSADSNATPPLSERNQLDTRKIIIPRPEAARSTDADNSGRAE